MSPGFPLPDVAVAPRCRRWTTSSHRAPSLALILGLVFLTGRLAEARTCRVDLTPNGDKYSCLTCHTRPTGGARNPFGLDVEAITGPTSSCAPRFWGPVLAALDSDGDGRSNGQELGDPTGAWTPGDPAPGDPSLVTRPGVAEVAPSGPKLTAVSPRVVSGGGGTLVRVTGASFTASTVVSLGGEPLTGQQLIDAATITGFAPPLPAGAPAGPRDVTVSNEFGSDTLAGAVTYFVVDGSGSFVRGDTNADLVLDLGDAVRILAFLFFQGPPPPCYESADGDDNGKIELTDAIHLLGYLFLGGPAPSSPFPDPGPDPTPDAIDCSGAVVDPAAFEVSPENVALAGIGSTLQLEVTARIGGVELDLSPGSEGTTYLSSAPAIVAVYRDGLLEARAPGSATIGVQRGERLLEVHVEVGAAAGSPAIKILAGSEYGVCFTDSQHSVFTLHPPFASLRAQVVRTEATSKVTVLGPGQVTVRVSPAVDGRGSVTSGSLDHTDFWSSAAWLALPRGAGITGLYLPGDAPSPGPQELSPVAPRSLWEAVGLPLAGVDDSGRESTFPLLRVTAIDRTTQAILGYSDVPVAVSREINCQDCHATGGVGTRDPGIPWSREEDLETQARRNVLLLHDARVRTNLAATAPVACVQCHYSALFDPEGLGPNEDQALTPTLSRALHGFHGRQLDANGDPLFPAAAPEAETCLRCHPGSQHESSRGVMHGAGLECRSCHGGLQEVAGELPLLAGGSIDGATDGEPRRPWKDVPRCGSCHTGDALSRLTGEGLVVAPDGFHLAQAYRAGDPAASPIKPTNLVFAENAGKSFSDSAGHGGLLCSACHGSPHAEWPNPTSSHPDNDASKKLQGHVGLIMECTACHTPGSMRPNLRGPHGMHPVNDRAWIHQEGIDNHGHLYTEGQANRCRACHGSDLRGTPLSRTAADRYYRIEDNIVANLPKGTPVGCNHCHRMPGSRGL